MSDLCFAINQGSKNQCQLSDKKGYVSSLGCFFGLLDANFFEDKQVILLTCDLWACCDYDAWCGEVTNSVPLRLERLPRVKMNSIFQS